MLQHKVCISSEDSFVFAQRLLNMKNRNFEHQKYIFFKGPKPTTICDFWSMVLQESIEQIVMLTNLKEGTKVNSMLL